MTGESALTELQERLAKASCGAEGGNQVAPTPSFQKTTEPYQMERGKGIVDGLEWKQDGGGMVDRNNTISLCPHGRKSAEGRRKRGGRHGKTADTKSSARENNLHNAVARPVLLDEATWPSPCSTKSNAEGVGITQPNNDTCVKQGSGLTADKGGFGREGIGGGRSISGEGRLSTTTRPET